MPTTLSRFSPAETRALFALRCLISTRPYDSNRPAAVASRPDVDRWHAVSGTTAIIVLAIREKRLPNVSWRAACSAAFNTAANDRRRLLTHETTKIETALSLLWFAAIQRIERTQDLASLAPKRCFITAEAVEREVRQIGETQKAARELNGRIDNKCDRIRLGGLHRLRCVHAARCRIAIVTCAWAPVPPKLRVQPRRPVAPRDELNS